MNKPLIVMCNGPSLKEIDLDSLRGHDIIGMNAAYRYYYKNDFWPKYFGCFDYRVTNNHEGEYKKLIEDSPIERVFLLKKISDSNKLTELPHNGNIGDFSARFKT